MEIIIRPTTKVTGKVKLPGDKSISHRLAMLGAIASGKTEISNFASSQDCHSTLSCLHALGVPVEVTADHVTITGRGLDGLQAPHEALDAGNSGTTIRMLSGLLAGQPFSCTISGDASLQRRPMKRVIDPLFQMGAQIQAREDNFPPLTIKGGRLRPIRYVLPVASAQVKSAILLAGLFAKGETSVIEPSRTRNHTELALREFGADVKENGLEVSVMGRPYLRGIRAVVPGDLSSAAFFLVAATCVAGSELLIDEAGLNCGRRGVIDVLSAMGAEIEIFSQGQQGGEPIGRLKVQSAQLRGGKLAGEQIPGIIDEIPILAVLATQTENGLEIRDASELRVKESDRIRAVVDNLRGMGASVEEFPDGLFVPGRQKLRGGRIKTHGDHRIAMAFSVAGLMADGETVIEEAECAAVSFPEFYEKLRSVTIG
ncbi:MAG: 3-phosphoshikimate 1-carboxyvinyltransferase [Acidobacteriota bacterium]